MKIKIENDRIEVYTLITVLQDIMNNVLLVDEIDLNNVTLKRSLVPSTPSIEDLSEENDIIIDQEDLDYIEELSGVQESMLPKYIKPFISIEDIKESDINLEPNEIHRYIDTDTMSVGDNVTPVIKQKK